VKNDSLLAFVIIMVAAFFVSAAVTMSQSETPLEREMLDADEIPGDWKLDPSMGGEASRTFYVGDIPDASPATIWLSLTQYDNTTIAHQEFISWRSYYSVVISQEPALGGECFLISGNSSSEEIREFHCRVGDTLIYCQVSFTEEHYLSEEWIFDLIRLQIEKIQ
jgi:hypothetical protein